MSALLVVKRSMKAVVVVLRKHSNMASSSNNLYSHLHFANTGLIAFTDHQGEETTYGQFHELICRVSTQLLLSQVTACDRVAAQLPKSKLALALCLACMKIGAVYVPLSLAFRLSEMRYFICDSKPKLLFVPAAKIDQYDDNFLRETKVSVICEDALAVQVKQQSPNYSVMPVHQDDVAAICYTSGTTGTSKGAMITHGNLTSNGITLQYLWALSKADILLHALPIDHIHGLFVALISCLMSGSSTILLPAFDIEQVVRWLPKSTMMMGVPTYYTRLIDFGHCQRKTLGHMRLLISGSAPLRPSTWVQFAENADQEIIERYGMTEGQIVCSNPLRGKRKPGTVGIPLPGIEVSIRQGVLHYRGPNTFKGYWGQAEKTRREFTKDGFFNSSDVACLDSEGYVQILGRSSDMIITGGLNVYPKEVEAVIDSIDSVQESAVIGLPDLDFGEAVVAVVVLKPAASGHATSSTILAELRGKIADYKVPKRVFFVQALPKNLMGKVKKNLLREKLSSSST
ncbi:AMP-binding enzyme family protein [Trichuris trichiura]|uniref:AMP-binding enzyme family protein n=1 Tax=Trichuris trichiura TaxID=36087 RepID=A0A077Z4C9_TRITR|nr:AMP-binding enzyme family protein [Trichuris trichiura]